MILAILVLLFLSSTPPVHSRGDPQMPAFLSDLISFVSPIKSEMISIDDVESNARLEARQTAVDSCDTQCSWVLQTQNCSNNVACDCQIVEAAGVSGVASCANCLQSINATLASQAVQIGEDCGVTAVPSLTFSFVTTSTPIKTVTPTSVVTGLTTVPTTTSVSIFTILPSNINSSSTIISSSASASNTPGNLSSSPTETSSGSSGLSSGAIGGIVGGIIGTFIILAALLFWLIRRYRSSMRRPVPLPITPVAPQPPAPKFVEFAPAPLPTIVEDVPSGRLRYPDEVSREPESPEGARLSRAY